MRKLALISGAAAGLVLMAGTASAQSCSTEVDILQRQLGFEQGTNARIGPTNTGVQQPSPTANIPGGYDTEQTAEVDRGDDPWDLPNTGANATIGPNDPGVQQPMPAQEAERFAERDMDEPGQQQAMDA